MLKTLLLWDGVPFNQADGGLLSCLCFILSFGRVVAFFCTWHGHDCCLLVLNRILFLSVCMCIRLSVELKLYDNHVYV